MSAEHGTYKDKCDIARDMDLYHADVEARGDIGTTTYGIGQVLKPQFSRPPHGGGTAPWAAFEQGLERGLNRAFD